MRIAKTDIVAGLPAPAAREFLRQVKNADFDQEWALTLLATNGGDKSETILGRFEEQGYIEQTGAAHNGNAWWTTTILGNAVAMASFGRPISRRTADRLVTEMLDRARTYNADPAKPYYVQRLRIFGSYLDKTIDPLGDVDVELILGQRTTDPQELLRYASESGRSFSTFMDKLLWPQKEAIQFLRHRSAAINITLEDIEGFTKSFETVYESEADLGRTPEDPKNPGPGH